MMKAEVRISVIIPTRNRKEFLCEAVASVLAQSFAEWELIVVDDASEDGTGPWLQSLSDSRIRVLRLESHRDRSAARNAGLAAARGEYVLFLDDDDWLLAGALANLFGAFTWRPAAIGAIGAYTYKNDWGSWNRGSHPRRRAFGSIWRDLLFGWIPIPSQSLLRRSAVVEAGGWNETMSCSEDVDLWLRLWRLGPAVLVPQAVVAYRIHSGQTQKAGTWKLNIELRRKAVARQSEDDRRRAECSILAHRLVRRSWRSLRQDESWKALRWWGKAVLSAPWLLASPASRALLAETGLRCLTHAALGHWVVAGLRKAKRACIRAYRGNLHPPSLGASTTGPARGPDGPS